MTAGMRCSTWAMATLSLWSVSRPMTCRPIPAGSSWFPNNPHSLRRPWGRAERISPGGIPLAHKLLRGPGSPGGAQVASICGSLALLVWEGVPPANIRRLRARVNGRTAKPPFTHLSLPLAQGRQRIIFALGSVSGSPLPTLEILEPDDHVMARSAGAATPVEICRRARRNGAGCRAGRGRTRAPCPFPHRGLRLLVPGIGRSGVRRQHQNGAARKSPPGPAGSLHAALCSASTCYAKQLCPPRSASV